MKRIGIALAGIAACVGAGLLVLPWGSNETSEHRAMVADPCSARREIGNGPASELVSAIAHDRRELEQMVSQLDGKAVRPAVKRGACS